MLRSWAVAVLLFLFVAFSGKSFGKDRDPLPGLFRDAMAADIGFPLLVGWRWTYRVEGRDTLFLETEPGKVFGDGETVLLRTKGGSFFWTQDLFLSVKDGGLFHHASGSGGRLWVERPPLVLLRRPLLKGSKWHSASENAESLSSLEFNATVFGRETVRVPAGEFKAWKIEYVLGDHLGTEHDLRAWYVSGLGFVQIEKWRESTLGKKSPVENPVVFQLARVEALRDAHPNEFPSRPKPVDELPQVVQAPDGKVTLYADYGDIWQGRVVLYLVNRTEETVNFPAQDSDLYIKQETRDGEGRWCRAQTHVYSFCNQSYSPVAVGPDEFIMVLGWLPEAGEEKEIRYKVYSEAEVISNIGKGRVDPRAIKAARYDEMSMAKADLGLIKEVLFEDVHLGERNGGWAERQPVNIMDARDVPPPGQTLEWARMNAMHRLESLSREESLPILQRLIALPDLTEGLAIESARILADSAPDVCRGFFKKVLTKGPPAVRTSLLERPFIFRRCADEELVSFLMKQLKDPQAPDLRLVMSALPMLESSISRRDEIKDLLREVQNSEKYPADLREAARYEREKAFGDLVLGLGLDRIDRDELERGNPVPFEILLQNTSEQTLTFRYSGRSAGRAGDFFEFQWTC